MSFDILNTVDQLAKQYLEIIRRDNHILEFDSCDCEAHIEDYPFNSEEIIPFNEIEKIISKHIPRKDGEVHKLIFLDRDSAYRVKVVFIAYEVDYSIEIEFKCFDV